MQGVAAKNDASYDLSRARASVTGQPTIAPSTATTSLPNGRIVTALFAGALFLSAFLLFVLEPMVAKSILPLSSRLLNSSRRAGRHLTRSVADSVVSSVRKMKSPPWRCDPVRRLRRPNGNDPSRSGTAIATRHMTVVEADERATDGAGCARALRIRSRLNFRR